VARGRVRGRGRVRARASVKARARARVGPDVRLHQAESDHLLKRVRVRNGELSARYRRDTCEI